MPQSLIRLGVAILVLSGLQGIVSSHSAPSAQAVCCCPSAGGDGLADSPGLPLGALRPLSCPLLTPASWFVLWSSLLWGHFELILYKLASDVFCQAEPALPAVALGSEQPFLLSGTCAISQLRKVREASAWGLESRFRGCVLSGFLHGVSLLRSEEVSCAR